MSGINKVILVGRAGADPETRYMADGGAVTNIRLATSETWTDKQSGEKKERTEWHRVVFFGRVAEVAGEYLQKGSQVYIEGQIRTRKWQDNDGNDRWSTEVVVSGPGSKMQMLGSPQGGTRPAQREGFRDKPQTTDAPQKPEAAEDDFQDDDIPF